MHGIQGLKSYGGRLRVARANRLPTSINQRHHTMRFKAAIKNIHTFTSESNRLQKPGESDAQDRVDRIVVAIEQSRLDPPRQRSSPLHSHPRARLTSVGVSCSVSADDFQADISSLVSSQLSVMASAIRNARELSSSHCRTPFSKTTPSSRTHPVIPSTFRCLSPISTAPSDPP